MKIYIAARFERKAEVLEIYKQVEKRGHSITADWTLHKPIKPYNQNRAMAREYATEDIQGVSDCDVFILISSEGGTGTNVELGVAIHSYLKFGKPKVYVVGAQLHANMMYFHPAVQIRKDVNEVLDELEK